MISEVIDPHCVSERETSTAAKRTAAEQSSPVFPLATPLCREMSLPALAAQCLQEIETYRRGEPYTESYGVELFRRATIEDDEEAWIRVQYCFGGLVRAWLRHHPNREAACRLESEENYVAQTFERFWLATTANQHVEFSTLAAALQYLRASLHGVIVDTLRTYARSRDISLPEPGEPQVEESPESSDVWEALKTMLSNPRERRVAYLLFYCRLKPREIVRLCPQEWRAVSEIYGLRRTILERLLRNADQLRWRLS